MFVNGTSDFKLGVFQQLLDQIFPGIIRTFATDPTVNQPAGPISYEPTFSIINAVLQTDWILLAREAMVYTTSNNNYIATQPPLDINFGILGLPDDTTIFYQNAAGTDWIPILFHFHHRLLVPLGLIILNQKCCKWWSS